MAQSLKLLSSPPSGIGNAAGPFPVSLLVARDELKQTVLKQVEEWQTKFTKQLVQESAALEIISGPLLAVEDLERRHTGREEAIRQLRDALALV